MLKKLPFVFIFMLICVNYSRGNDTLYTNPNYPPIVYRIGEYKFFKYTAKYVPVNLLQAFKILGTHSASVLLDFKDKSSDEVLVEGIYSPNARLHKEFGLAGYTQFSIFFHQRGIYDPYLMESYILLAFHQYLNQDAITWKANKKLILKRNRKQNRKWKKRKRKLFKRGELREQKTKAPKDKRVKSSKIPDFGMWQEYDVKD
jgi:hypothetical protein